MSVLGPSLHFDKRVRSAFGPEAEVNEGNPPIKVSNSPRARARAPCGTAGNIQRFPCHTYVRFRGAAEMEECAASTEHDAIDPKATFRWKSGNATKLGRFRAWSSSPFDREDTPFAGDTLEGPATAVAEA
jgi:hypothetical protein